MKREIKEPVLPKGWVRFCMDRIREECGYVSYADLAHALGESRANMNAWIQRDTYGQTGAARLHDLTGANINWLMARSDDAFPNGPTINPALKLSLIYEGLTELRRQTLAFARALSESETTRELISAWKMRIADAAHPTDHQNKSFREALVGLLEFAHGSAAVHEARARRDPSKRK